jgi:hypothetical protein
LTQLGSRMVVRRGHFRCLLAGVDAGVATSCGGSFAGLRASDSGSIELAHYPQRLQDRTLRREHAVQDSVGSVRSPMTSYQGSIGSVCSLEGSSNRRSSGHLAPVVACLMRCLRDTGDPGIMIRDEFASRKTVLTLLAPCSRWVSENRQSALGIQRTQLPKTGIDKVIEDESA